MNLNEVKPAREQLNLNELSDAEKSQIHWPATLVKPIIQVIKRQLQTHGKLSLS